MGPVGSAKTSSCLRKFIDITLAQAPSPVDGIARTKFAVVRDTYRQIKSTVLPSWHGWIPKSVGSWSASEPMRHTISLKINDRKYETTIEFFGLGENKIEDVMRGWEGTGAYINEADLLSRDVLTFLRGRVGRYPSKIHGGASWSGVWLDFNAPDIDNWMYDLFVENKPDSFAFFKQPSGLSAEAENLHNLPEGYYRDQMDGQPDWYIRRMIKNEFGFTRDGKPVYTEYNDDRHIMPAQIRPVREWGLQVGVDAGRTPSAIFGQQAPTGQWLIFSELIGEDMGVKRFAEAINQHTKEFYPGFRIAGWGDPAAAYKSDMDEASWLQILTKDTGIPFRPAPSNSPVVRLEAVRGCLSRTVEDFQPGFLLSEKCKVLRKGFNSGYHYKRVQGTDGQFADKPNKNQYSHPHDGLQYLLLGGGEHHEVYSRQKSRANAGKTYVAKTNFKVFG